MAEKQTGKQRATRIPLDYYSKPNRMEKLKLGVTAGVVVLTVIWMGTRLIGVPNSNRDSPGAVTSKHASFEQNCSACHVNFAFLAGSKELDKKCQQCHLEGPQDVHAVRYAEDKKVIDATVKCGECHKDHWGVDHSLVRMEDGSCTKCHKDLKKYVDDPHYDNAITSFHDKHPEFKLFAKGKPIDPGKLKFNHKYHMTPGIVLTEGGKPFTLDDIDPAEREKYRGAGQQDKSKDATHVVRLECASCHGPDPNALPPVSLDAQAPDSAEGMKASLEAFSQQQERRGRSPSGELLPPRRSGAYMGPVNYKNHCAACHKVDFDAQISQQVTHGIQPPKVKEELTQLFLSEYNRDPKAFGKKPAPAYVLPGQNPDQQTEEPPNKDQLLKGRIDTAFRTLMSGSRCGECHVSKDGGELSASTQEIAPPNIPGVKLDRTFEPWLAHARFNHATHAEKGINCKDCHSAAYPSKDLKDVLTSHSGVRRGAEEVMIPNKANCLQCHSPSPVAKTVSRVVKARFDCTECHGYHNGTPAGKPAGSAALQGLDPHGQMWAYNRRDCLHPK